MDGIHLVKHDRREPHVFVLVMGRFKGEDGGIMHLLLFVNVTLSDIRIRICLERLVALLNEEGKTSCPVFCDMEGYIFLWLISRACFIRFWKIFRFTGTTTRQTLYLEV